MENKSEEEFCVQYHANKSCLEASGRFFTRSITLGPAYSVICLSAESNHEPKRAKGNERTHTHGTSTGVCEHRAHILTVYTVYLRAKIGVIYSTADAYAIGLFIDLQSGSVCMHSGSYFLNPRDFGVLNIFLPFVSYSILSQVCFIHNFCNLTDTANPQ
jgi:hypothetical protein